MLWTRRTSVYCGYLSPLASYIHPFSFFHLAFVTPEFLQKTSMETGKMETSHGTEMRFQQIMNRKLWAYNRSYEAHS